MPLPTPHAGERFPACTTGPPGASSRKRHARKLEPIDMFRRRLVVVRRPRLLGAALLGGAGFLIGRRRASQVVTAPAPAPSAPAAPATAAPSLMPDGAPDAVDRLGELARLHEDGSLTDEEFSQAKREVLGS
jgi:hypothetical protein